MDTYQPIYDAVRSKISGGNISDAADRAMRDLFDISHAKALLQEQIGMVGGEMSRPSVLFRVKVFLDDDQWCALYGENLQEGVAGFGKSPHIYSIARKRGIIGFHGYLFSWFVLCQDFL